MLAYPHFSRIETECAIFDLRLPLAQADGVINYYSPDAALLDVQNKPRAWFHIEPAWHSMYRGQAGRRLLKQLRFDERFWFGNPDPRYRVPHPTHYTKPRMQSDGARQGVAALVSNFGGRLWFFNSDFRLRNRFITCSLVELYGAHDSWARWRTWYGKRGVPSNYRGKVAGTGWSFQENINFLSRFHAVVCLENSRAPFYFTEKFVNAVCAGCVPIYHAHKTVRETFLRDARWIDPQDYAFDARTTVQAALDANRAEFNEVNRCWLEQPELARTQEDTIWERVGRIFAFKCGRIDSI